MGRADSIADTIDRAVGAWRQAVPAGAAPENLLRHGRRMWELLGPGTPEAAAGALAVATVLHEVGRFVRDRGHYAARGARWVGTRLDQLLPGVSPFGRRLAGELILFHRHLGPLPGDLADRNLVDRFRRAEMHDRSAGRMELGFPPAALPAATAAHARGSLRATLLGADLREHARHPILARRVTWIRRPDR